MRILILNSEYPPVGGGAGNASANIAHWLAQMGHEITVVTSRFDKLPHKEQHSNLTVYRIPALRVRQDRSRPLEQLSFLISAAIWTLGLASRFKWNATVAFFGIPSGAIAFLLKKIFNIPYIVSLRGGDVPGFRPYDFLLYHKILSPFFRTVWKNAAGIVANSNGLRDLAMDFDSSFAISIIPNGVDLELYQTGAREWSVPRLLSVGRLVYQKGLDVATRALAGLKDVPWEWHIAGDGPQMQALQSLAKEMNVEDRVVFHGWQSREELIELYQQCNVFLFPSRHEGMPNAVLEAMASGLPVIASCIAGNEELVIDSKTGYLVASEDVESLRVALKKILYNPTLGRQMGIASRHHVEENYSWESTAQQYALLLEKVK
jgi:glycosyltransferase involved in cell wall biosynthesis